MTIEEMEFSKLEKSICRTGKSVLDYLAPKVGKVYVVAITREACPACKKQKPKLEELATALKGKNEDKLLFVRIHVKRPPDSDKESLRSKDAFKHYFYPTSLILLRTKDRGAFEYYRNVSPAMSELKKSIGIALKVAQMFEKEMK